MKDKAARAAQIERDLFYAENRLNRTVLAAPQDVRDNNWRSTYQNERGQECYLVKLMPPRREGQKWAVRCDGRSLVAIRECRNEQHARQVFTSINDLTTLKTLLKHRGFRYDW